MLTKYKSRSLKYLDEYEQLREINQPKIKIPVALFEDDHELAKKLGINITRILRHKLHEWLREKIDEEKEYNKKMAQDASYNDGGEP